MVISKALVVGGMLGLAAVAGVTTYTLLSSKNRGEDDKSKLGENHLGIPGICKSDEVKKGQTRSCQLNEEQLKKIKFAHRKDDVGMTITGLEGNKKIDVNIEWMDDAINYPKSKKYTLTNRNDSEVKIMGKENKDIVLTKDKTVELRESGKEDRLERFRKVDELGIPKDCIKECELSAFDLKQIKFRDIGESKVKVEGLNEGEKVKLKIEDVDDKTKYPEGKKYTFNNGNGKDVTIKNAGGNSKTITLVVNKGVLFSKEEGKLVEVEGQNG